MGDIGVEAMVCMSEKLGAAEMFWEDSGIALRDAKGLALRIARRRNERVSHYDGSEIGRGIKNVQEVKTL